MIHYITDTLEIKQCIIWAPKNIIFIYFKKRYFPFRPKMLGKFIKTDNALNASLCVKNILTRKHNSDMFVEVCAAI